MYWRDETAPAWHRLWRHVQTELQDCPNLSAPETLPRNLTQHWLSGDLYLSQTCGLPFRTVLKHRVTYVGTFDFGLDGAMSGEYRSVAVTRADETREWRHLRLAYNAADSQSGWAAAHSTLGARGVDRLAGYLETGSHAASARAVRNGDADLAFLDEVTWRLLMLYDGRLDHLRIVARTPPTPGLPLISRRGIDPDPLRRALSNAIAQIPASDRIAMGGLRGLTVIPEDCYFTLPAPLPPPN